MPWRIAHLDRECDRDFGADILDLLPGGVRHPGHVDEQVVFADLDAFEGLAGEVGDVGADTGELIEGSGDRGCARRSGRRVGDRSSRTAGRRVPQIDLAAHDKADEIVADRLPAMRAASGILVPGMLPALSKKPSMARRPVSRNALTAASECCGEWWICEMSSTVVTPASSCESPPNSSLM